MKNRTIILIGAFLLTASAVAATGHENEGNNTYNGLEGYYWEYNDTGQYVAEGDLRNGTFSENIGYDIEAILDEGELDTSASIIVGAEPDEGSDLNAVFSVDPVRPEPGEEVAFNASYSEGDIAEFNWDVDGDNETDYRGEHVEHVYDDPGLYEASLAVRNEDGGVDTASTDITVGSDTDTGSSSSSGDSAEIDQGDQESNITLTSLPGQAIVDEPITVSGYLSNNVEESVTILVDDEVKVNTSTDSDGRFSEEITLTALGQSTVTVASDGEEKSGLVNVRPVLSITDVNYPSEADVHENFDVCVEADSRPGNPAVTLTNGDGDTVGQEESDETCFELYENSPGSHSYTVSASIGDYSEEEQISVEVQDPQSSDTSSPATGGFFRDNASLLLSGLGILTAAGFFYRRRSL